MGSRDSALPPAPVTERGAPSLPHVSLDLGQHKMWNWPSKPPNYLEILKRAQETPSTLQEGGIDDHPILGLVWQSVCYLSHVLENATKAQVAQR